MQNSMIFVFKVKLLLIQNAVLESKDCFYAIKKWEKLVFKENDLFSQSSSRV